MLCYSWKGLVNQDFKPVTAPTATTSDVTEAG
jgi:hypothetical protein